MTDEEQTPDPDQSHDAARAELDALEAQMPTLQRALMPWIIRVAVLGVAVFAVMQWQGTDTTLFVPLVAIYAAVSFALTYYAYTSRLRAIEKRRATLLDRIEAGSEDDT